MSFDLAVWRSEHTPSDTEARGIYGALLNDMCGAGPKEPGIEEFYTDLTRRYPELDDVPEDGVDQCPGSVKLNRSGHHVIMSAVWSRSKEIRAVALELARKHGLILFDPQEGKVFWPDRSPEKKRFSWL
jgi:hypothetical protein